MHEPAASTVFTRDGARCGAAGSPPSTLHAIPAVAAVTASMVTGEDAMDPTQLGSGRGRLPSPRPIRTILTATDLTPASSEATDRAIDLAARLDARLLIVNVLEKHEWECEKPISVWVPVIDHQCEGVSPAAGAYQLQPATPLPQPRPAPQRAGTTFLVRRLPATGPTIRPSPPSGLAAPIRR